MPVDVFSSNPGFAGYFGPTSGTNVQVAFSRGNVAVGSIAQAAANQGFLADSYTINWSRGVTQKRMLNVVGSVAIVGYGTGTVQFTGLLGTKQGFDNLLGTTGGTNLSATNADVCQPLTITIGGAAGFTPCTNNAVGGTTAGAGNPIKLILNSAILSTINVTGSVQDNGVIFQQASVAFTIGGFQYDNA